MITAKQFLAAAWSYFNNKESLIYSWAGQTFLSGSPLFDAEHANKGNIDCSTYVHLALMGIPYESSPYATGDAQLLFPLADPASDQPLIDGLQESMHMNLYHRIDFMCLPKSTAARASLRPPAI